MEIRIPSEARVHLLVAGERLLTTALNCAATTRRIFSSGPVGLRPAGSLFGGAGVILLPF